MDIFESKLRRQVTQMDISTSPSVIKECLQALRSQGLQEFRKKTGCKQLGDGYEALLRNLLGRALAFHRKDWGGARQELLDVLRLAKKAEFRSQPSGPIKPEFVVDSTLVDLAIVEFCGFEDTKRAFACLNGVDHPQVRPLALRVEGRILADMHHYDEAIVRLTQADRLSGLTKRDKDALQRLRLGKDLPPKFKLGAIDLT